MERRAEAENRLYDALAAAMPRARSMAHLWLCAMFHVARRLPEAQRHAESSLAIATELGDGAMQALATAHLAALSAASGDVERARALFGTARTHALCNDAQTIAALVEVTKSFLDVGSDDALAPIFGDTMLEVGADGLWMRVPGGERIDMSRRRSLRLVLLALCDKRERDSGVALGHAELLEAGWPGERMRSSAGEQRVRTAIWTLRKLGLGEWLVTRDDGYLLDPAVRVVRASS